MGRHVISDVVDFTDEEILKNNAGCYRWVRVCTRCRVDDSVYGFEQNLRVMGVIGN